MNDRMPSAPAVTLTSSVPASDLSGEWEILEVEDDKRYRATLDKAGNGPYTQHGGRFVTTQFANRLWQGTWQQPGNENLEDPALILQDWTTIQHTMWNYVGIVRTYERLKRAVADMRALGNRLTKFYHESTISKPLVELFHGQQMAEIVAEFALRNPSSRGAHFRRD